MKIDGDKLSNALDAASLLDESNEVYKILDREYENWLEYDNVNEKSFSYLKKLLLDKIENSTMYVDEYQQIYDILFTNDIFLESKKYKEDFEFYKTPAGISVDKVVVGGSKAGKSFRDGTPDSGSGDTSNVVKRIPFNQMSDDDKALARAAYKTLKMNGDIGEVDKKFKTSPRPDVVMKSDGAHADIYYDDNVTGEPDERNVRLAASKKRTSFQSSHSMREDAKVYKIYYSKPDGSWDFLKSTNDPDLAREFKLKGYKVEKDLDAYRMIMGESRKAKESALREANEDAVPHIIRALHNVAKNITGKDSDDLQDIAEEAYHLADEIEDEGPNSDNLYFTDEVGKKLWNLRKQQLAEPIFDALHAYYKKY